METQKFTINDLILLEKSLYAFQQKQINLGYIKNDEIDMLMLKIKQAINPEIYSDND